jgi:DNA (cytosine-5)-methyltransferase 1
MIKFKFVDLFAGVGGFHIALKNLGGECVYSAEINKKAAEVYKKNFRIDPLVDITLVEPSEIEKHDLLTAGFPCQPFSKAGKRLGLNDTRGTLFFDIERILNYHKPKYIILENVKNLTTHNQGETLKIIQENLNSIGYRLTEKPLLLSPHQIGIPQMRERVFIVGVYDPKKKNSYITINLELKRKKTSIYTVVDKKRVDKSYYLNNYELNVLETWNKFYRGLNLKVIGFPVWVEYLINKPKSDHPEWKKSIIRKNNNLYNNNKEFIDAWLVENNYLKGFIPTHRKFEWQAGTEISTIWEGLIQFRPSGIRVKRPDKFPSLVAMNHTPIIGKYKRRITTEEAMKLQSFPKNFKFGTNKANTYRQLGNSVNTKLIEKIAVQLLTKQVF